LRAWSSGVIDARDCDGIGLGIWPPPAPKAVQLAANDRINAMDFNG
jgi:hypothetical protein